MWAPEVQQQLTFPNTGDLAADFKTQIKSVIDLSNDPNFGPSFRALVAEGQHDQALASQLLARIFRPRIEAAKERLRAAQQDGQLAPDLDLDLAIDLFYGGFYHRFLLRVAAPQSRARRGGRRCGPHWYRDERAVRRKGWPHGS
jgi:hypothetical protein